MSEIPKTGGQTFVKQDGTERYVPEAELKRYADSDQWSPKTGKVRVSIPDKNGVYQPRSMSITAYRLAKEVGGGLGDIRLVGDEEAQVFEQARQDEKAVLERKVAEESGGTAMATAALPGAVSLATAAGLSGDLAKDARGDNERLREANPIETAIGTAGQFALTTALTGGAIGAARAGVAAARAGGAAEAMFAAQETLSAARMFGYADAAGNYISAGLVARGAGQTVANVIGRGASSVLLSAPGSVVYEAAIRADTDPGYTSESFMTSVSNDIILGAAVDFGLPLIGKAIQGVGKAVGTAGKLSPLRLGGKLLRTFRAGKAALSNDVDTLYKLETMHRALATKATGNAAARTVAKDVLEDAAEAGVRRAEITEMLSPAKLAGSRSIPKGFDDALDAAMGSQAVDHADVLLAREARNNYKGLEKGVGVIENTGNQIQSAGLGHISKLNVSGPLPRANGLRVELALSASELQRALPRDAADALALELDGLIGLGKGDGARSSVNRMLALRNKVMMGDYDEGVKAIVRKHIDKTLTDDVVMGTAASKLGDILSASDTFIGAAKKTQGLTSNLKNLDNIVDDVPLGGVASNIDELDQAYATLAMHEAVGSGDARYVTARIKDAQGKLERLAPQLEGAAAMNRVRNALAGEGDIILHAPGTGTSTEQLVAAKVEANVTFSQKLAKAIDDFAKNPQARVGTRGAGIFMFREMKSFKEKKAAYQQATQSIQAATGTPQDLQRTIANITKNIGADPMLNSALQQRLVQKFMYLNAQIPQPPPGMLPQEGSVYASPAEVSNFLEVLGASDDPVTVMQSALEGTLNESALATIEALFPVQTSEMRVSVTQIMQDPETKSKLTYQQRLSLDLFAGGGREFAATPGALVIQGSRSAQTPAQEAAMRGRPGKMKNPTVQEPTAADRLSAL